MGQPLPYWYVQRLRRQRCGGRLQEMDAQRAFIKIMRKRFRQAAYENRNQECIAREGFGLLVPARSALPCRHIVEAGQFGNRTMTDFWDWLMCQRCRFGWHKWIWFWDSPGQFCAYCGVDRDREGRAVSRPTRDTDDQGRTPPDA